MKNLEGLKLFEKIEIQWEDSVADHGGWCPIEDYDFDGHKEAMRYSSTGYFLKKDGNSFFFCSSYRKDGHITGVYGVPFSAINKVIKL